MKSAWRNLTPEQAAQIRLLYEAGESSPALAKQFGFDPTQILRIVRNAGGTVRTLQESLQSREGKPTKKHKLTSDQEMEIRLLYEAGTGSSTLAKQFGFDPTEILRIVRDAGGTVRTLQESRNLRPPTPTPWLHTPDAKLKWLESRNGTPSYSAKPSAVSNRKSRRRENQHE